MAAEKIGLVWSSQSSVWRLSMFSMRGGRRHTDLLREMTLEDQRVENVLSHCCGASTDIIFIKTFMLAYFSKL